MKKLIAIALIAVMVLGLAACGTVNKTEVAVLWSGDGVVKVPNSLINAVERAMYIENITYKHYGANGDQATQTKQAEDALKAGCAALMVELVDGTAAQAIVDAAKAKNVPVVFINSDVEGSVVNSYDKCALVNTDDGSVGDVEATLLFENYVKEEKGFFDFLTGKEPTYTLEPDCDFNKDGSISYIAIGNVSAIVDSFNAKLAEKGLSSMTLALEGETYSALAELTVATHQNEKGKEISHLNTAAGVPVELILVENDTAAQEVLVALQAKGYNKDKLKTHLIPVYTVGNAADYKALVLAGKPAGAHTDDNVQEYFKSMQYIVDLRTVEEEDLSSMIYTTGDIISDGRIAGSAIEDYDNIAVSAAAALAGLLKGETLKEAVILIPYTTLN